MKIWHKFDETPKCGADIVLARFDSDEKRILEINLEAMFFCPDNDNVPKFCKYVVIPGVNYEEFWYPIEEDVDYTHWATQEDFYNKLEN